MNRGFKGIMALLPIEVRHNGLRAVKRLERISALLPILTVLLLVLGAVGCGSEESTTTAPAKKPNPLEQLRPTARSNFLKARLGLLAEVPVPADNPLTPAKVELGKHLFFEPRLGGEGKTSCASCHQPDKAWSDGRARPIGVRNHRGLRNTPTLLNVAYYKVLYWDGRASSLEQQALMALSNPEEMANSVHNAVKTISAIESYRPLFTAAFGSEQVTADRIAQAIASFERTLVTGPSPFDRFLQGDLNALTAEQKEGLSLFLTRAECVGCHRGPLFSNEEFMPSGIYVAPDWGRYNWTKKDYDMGKFRVPSLRNVALTAPYFHNGSEPSLVQAAFFRAHGKTRKELAQRGIEPYMLSRHFTEQELKQMTAFMEALTGELPKIEVVHK